MRRRGLLTMSMALAVIAAAFLAPPTGSAAKGEARPPEEEATIIVSSPHHENRNVLGMKVYAEQGVAVLWTDSSDIEFDNDRGVAYAVRIPRRPLDGRIDVRFPGLGRIVGRIDLQGKSKSSGPQNACGEPREVTASGHFHGSVVFRGSGGYGTWRAADARLFTTRKPGTSCEAAGSGGAPESRQLFDYFDGFGPLLLGGGERPISELRAVLPGRRRTTELIAEIRFPGPDEAVGFIAFDYERLGGGVLCKRWADRRGMPRRDRFDIAPGAARPPAATVRPPRPFSGEATYSRQGRTFLGDLSVHMLGRTVRLAGKGAEALVENAE